MKQFLSDIAEAVTFCVHINTAVFLGCATRLTIRYAPEGAVHAMTLEMLRFEPARLLLQEALAPLFLETLEEAGLIERVADAEECCATCTEVPDDGDLTFH